MIWKRELKVVNQPVGITIVGPYVCMSMEVKQAWTVINREL